MIKEALNSSVRIVSVTLLSGVLLLRCSESERHEPQPNYFAFLNQDNPTFKGKVDDNVITWSFGLSGFQMMSGFQKYGDCDDSTNYSRFAQFGLMTEDHRNNVTLYSPVFDVKNPDWFEEVFGAGVKPIGDFHDNFHLIITHDGHQMQTSSLINGEFEILKSEEFTNFLYEKNLRVWMRFSSQLTSCDCSQETIKLKDGLMIAEFWDYKNLK